MNSVSLAAAASSPSNTEQNPRLTSAAHEFEASLMKEFLKPLQHDGLFAEDGDKDEEDSSGSAGTLMSYGSEMMAKAISEHGGFGIAQKIIEHFQAAGNHSQSDHEGSVHF